MGGESILPPTVARHSGLPPAASRATTWPASMAAAFRMAVEAGRQGFLAGLAGIRPTAQASSPLTGFLA